ncbi:MAG: hypothetical protein HXX09_13320 [Bacteroidetes bacterium]|nr:hypothetical protein [Bacteroidota bacterium]
MCKEIDQLITFIKENSDFNQDEIKNFEEHEIRQLAQKIESEIKLKKDTNSKTVKSEIQPI